MSEIEPIPESPKKANQNPPASASLPRDIDDIHRAMAALTEPLLGNTSGGILEEHVIADPEDIKTYKETVIKEQWLVKEIIQIEDQLFEKNLQPINHPEYNRLKEAIVQCKNIIKTITTRYNIPFHDRLRNSIDYIDIILSDPSVKRRQEYRDFANHVITPRKDNETAGELLDIICRLGKNNPSIADQLVQLDQVSKGAGLQLLVWKKRYLARLCEYRATISPKNLKAAQKELYEMIAFAQNIKVPNMEFFEKFGLEIYEYPKALQISHTKETLQDKLRQDYVDLLVTADAHDTVDSNQHTAVSQEILRRRAIIKNANALVEGQFKKAAIVHEFIDLGMEHKTFEYLDEKGNIAAKIEVEYQKVVVGQSDLGGLSSDLNPGDHIVRITKLRLLPIIPATRTLDVLEAFNCSSSLPVLCPQEFNVRLKNSRSTGLVLAPFPDTAINFARLLHELGHFVQATDPDLLPYLHLKVGKDFKLWESDQEPLIQDLATLPPYSPKTHNQYRLVTRIMERDANARALRFLKKAKDVTGSNLLQVKFDPKATKENKCSKSIKESIQSISITDDMNASLASYEATTLEMKQMYRQIPRIPTAQKMKLHSMSELDIAG